MIKKELIEQLATDALEEEFFLVDVKIRKDNNIEVIIDGDHGVSIQKCVDVSRNIEHNLDRDQEDFELSVLSAGLGKPFTVKRQYIKNIGKMVEVIPQEGKPLSGILKEANEEGFVIETSEMVRPEKKKKKVEVKSEQRFSYNDQPKVKNIISFK